MDAVNFPAFLEAGSVAISDSLEGGEPVFRWKNSDDDSDGVGQIFWQDADGEIIDIFDELIAEAFYQRQNGIVLCKSMNGEFFRLNGASEDEWIEISMFAYYDTQMSSLNFFDGEGATSFVDTPVDINDIREKLHHLYTKKKVADQYIDPRERMRKKKKPKTKKSTKKKPNRRKRNDPA